ncbi:MAG TPA: M20/M25/M40 family metallo-hydrolase [Candidatus Hydrogenedentes bacterium]|nr:M20/M25/M40 family metallo-hydrolase [Candidatus Hydrogenedentota bacterium]
MKSGSGDGHLAAIVFGVALFAAVFAWWMSLAPTPLPENAPADEFSAYRAMKHVQQMAVEPHPGGSHANEKVYDYITAQLKALNVEMTVERPILPHGHGRAVERVGAILVRIPGTESSDALAIDAHFDSTPYGPGAADDISGIAAMIETIRALKASPPLKNSIIFCFADKEEMGSTGGPGVFSRHPWFKDVRAVLGLEVRGTSGPALMFETGPENGFLIRQMAQSAAKPRATSIMFDFYKRMPFGSDFNFYKKQGLPGLNVAYIDSFCNYHTKLDNPENVSLASLQHHGCYALGLARQLGNTPLANCKAPDATYFNTLGSHMVVYPRDWGWPLAIGAWAILAVILAFGFAKKRLSITGILGTMGIYLLAVLLSAVVITPLAVAVYFMFHEHALYRDHWFAIAFSLMGLGIFMMLARLVRERVRPQNLFAGTVLLWALLLLAFQWLFPGGAYAALWPLAFLSFGLLAMLLCKDPEGPQSIRLALVSLIGLPVVLLLAPMAVMCSYTLTSLTTPGLLVLIFLIVAIYLPQMKLIPLKHHLFIGAGMFAVGVLLLGLAIVSNTPSPSRPRQNSLSYAVNFDTNEAWWLSSDKKFDEWMHNFFSDDAPWEAMPEFLGRHDKFKCRRAPAPMPPFEKAVLKVLDDRVEDGRRKLKLFVDSPRDAQHINIHLKSNVQVFSAKALGIPIEGDKHHWRVSLDTIPFEGGEVELETEPDKPLTFLVREESYSIPALQDFPPRPDYMMVEPNRTLERHSRIETNRSFSLCTYTF